MGLVVIPQIATTPIIRSSMKCRRMMIYLELMFALLITKSALRFLFPSFPL